jgi:hypothetical protein
MVLVVKEFETALRMPPNREIIIFTDNSWLINLFSVAILVETTFVENDCTTDIGNALNL